MCIRDRLYHRLNQDYQPMHGLCRFFLEHSGPTHQDGDSAMIPFVVHMPALFEKFVAFREQLGMEVLGFGAGDLVGTLVDRVNSGRIVGLVGDRDLSRHGIPVTFFGEPTRMPAGAALVARRTGATLLAVNFFYRDGEPAATVFDPIPVPTSGSEEDDIRTITQSIAGRFELGISEHPSDWHMLQPLWLADLDPDRLAPTGSPS